MFSICSNRGVVWDGESGEVMSPDRAAEMTREIDRSAPQGQQQPADLLPTIVATRWSDD